MKQNMGRPDRIIRILVAILFVVLWFTHTVTGMAGYVLLILAGVFLITSIVGSCPLYSLFGINTCNRKKTV